ncbi:MAG TPA: hypothetical protein VIF15_09120 [Polyangiaceae bacterium]|jgi:hypothetical protein
MSPGAEPVVRARHLQQWLENVTREEDPGRARFFASLPAEVRSTIEGASRVAWLPVALHVQLADVLRDAFGPARAHDYYRRAFAASLAHPPFDALVRTGARLLGLTPGSFLRWAPRGYETSFRNCGTLSTEALGPSRGHLVYRSLPGVCTASDAWLDSFQSTVYGVFDVLHIQGVVRLDKSRRGEGSVEIELEWSEGT